MGRQPQTTATRRELAAWLGVHPDAITRNLAAGLGCAVVKWGGRGKEHVFDRAQALRWAGAWRCRSAPRTRGQACRQCEDVLEDMRYTAEHLRQARHGRGGCPECSATWPLLQPCRAWTEGASAEGRPS
jgi:hypothetical protein